MGLGTERRRRLRAAVQEDGVPLLRLGGQLQGRKVRGVSSFPTMATTRRCPSATDSRPLQLLHREDPPQVRCQAPRDRDQRLPTATEAPRRHRALHQRPDEAGMPEEVGSQPDPGQGRSAAGLNGSRQQAGEQAGHEYERQCERCLVTVPRRSEDGLGLRC